MLQTTTIDDKLGTLPRVDYGVETRTCKEKYDLWEREGFSEAKDMIKSVLIAYQKGDQEHYIIACTTGRSRIDFAEIAYELSLSKQEAETFSTRLEPYEVEEITGKRVGEVSPLIDVKKLEKIDAVYFTRELMWSAERTYDVPLSLSKAILISAKELFQILSQKSAKYKTYSHQGSYNIKREQEHLPETDFSFEVIDNWQKVKPKDSKLSFIGTKISYDGLTYVLKQPRTKKEGSRSKRVGCIATLLDDDRIKHREDGRIHRVVLPISYEEMETRYKTHFFRKRSHKFLTEF